MYHRSIWVSLASLWIVVGLACSDFIEYPLDGASVGLKAPQDSLYSLDTIVHFWWDKHEDARFYRLQIVSPNFDSVRSSIIDTVVSTDKISFRLRPGHYTWRLRPENHGSVGKFNYRTFSIETSSNEE